MNTDCWYYYNEDNKDICCKGQDIQWCDENCPIYKNMKANFEKSNLPELYWAPFKLNSTPKDKKEIVKLVEIRKNLANFVAEGKNLLLQSSKCGNGKTSWGIKLLQKQIELNYKGCNWPPAFFIYTPQLLLEARKSITAKNSNFETLQSVLQHCPLAMFDDIGCIALKDYDLLILSTIIETRILNGLSSIFTTNLEGEALKAVLGERLYDRISRLSEVITFKSDSMRGTND